jgi:hypothetical protein
MYAIGMFSDGIKCIPSFMKSGSGIHVMLGYYVIVYNEELKRVVDTFLKYHMKILLGDFSAEVGREDILN